MTSCSYKKKTSILNVTCRIIDNNLINQTNMIPIVNMPYFIELGHLIMYSVQFNQTYRQNYTIVTSPEKEILDNLLSGAIVYSCRFHKNLSICLERVKFLTYRQTCKCQIILMVLQTFMFTWCDTQFCKNLQLSLIHLPHFFFFEIFYVEYRNER